MTTTEQKHCGILIALVLVGLTSVASPTMSEKNSAGCVLILGGVRQPGFHKLDNTSTPAEMIQQCGGSLVESANKELVLIRRRVSPSTILPRSHNRGNDPFMAKEPVIYAIRHDQDWTLESGDLILVPSSDEAMSSPSNKSSCVQRAIKKARPKLKQLDAFLKRGSCDVSYGCAECSGKKSAQ